MLKRSFPLLLLAFLILPAALATGERVVNASFLTTGAHSQVDGNVPCGSPIDGTTSVCIPIQPGERTLVLDVADARGNAVCFRGWWHTSEGDALNLGYSWFASCGHSSDEFLDGTIYDYAHEIRVTLETVNTAAGGSAAGATGGTVTATFS